MRIRARVCKNIFMSDNLVADFHIHSKFSRACSKNLTLPNIATACELKGIDLIATSDFTHPAWMKHIEEELEEVQPGIFALTSARSKTRFLLVTEISSIYSQGGKVRRVHSLVFAPSIAVAKKFITALQDEGCNLKSDGRPIVGVSAKELVRIAREISPEMEVVPAHAWTPWFSVFGSKSGFDSLEECYEEMTPFVHAIETGLSSDPAMNWQLSKLDSITLISNSDAHSLEKLGREATVFTIDASSEYTYADVIDAIRGGAVKETIEFFPEEGKYHVDGHATCNFSCTPEETKKLGGVCPVCGKKIITVGVLSRVHDLADRSTQEVIHTTHVPYRKIIPLLQLIAHVFEVGESSKKVRAVYDEMVKMFGTEFAVLLDVPIEKIKLFDADIANVIAAMRSDNIKITPGYDGVFGKIELIKKVSKRKNSKV